MAFVTRRQLLDEAAKGVYGVGAVQRQQPGAGTGDMEAASETNSPVINHPGEPWRPQVRQRPFLYHLMVAAEEVYPEVPLALHQDHGNGPDTCRSAIELGFTSGMMDGSLQEDGNTPADFEYNVRVTREVVEMAHERGVTVEGELGTLGGIEDGHAWRPSGKPDTLATTSRSSWTTWLADTSRRATS